MPKLFPSTLIALTGVIAGLVPMTTAQAMYLEQHQSASSDLSFECSGTCDQKVSVSSHLHQRQLFTSNSESYQTQPRGSKSWRLMPRGNHDGKATLTWDDRGGTCTIRYTEANARWYRYQTSTACDDGQLEIGGLKRGKAYRFQVKKADGQWSSPVRLVAQ